MFEEYTRDKIIDEIIFLDGLVKFYKKFFNPTDAELNKHSVVEKPKAEVKEKPTEKHIQANRKSSQTYHERNKERINKKKRDKYWANPEKYRKISRDSYKRCMKRKKAAARRAAKKAMKGA